MKYSLISLLIIFNAAILHNGVAQCLEPVIDITKTDFCSFENIDVQSSASGYESLEWDFCAGELGATPSSSVHTVLSGTLLVDAFYIEANNNWYGFLVDRSANSISRLDFGSSLLNVPVQTDLGNISSLLNSPDKIVIHQENGMWYGLITNDKVTDNLILLDFGGNIENIPTGTMLGDFDGKLNRPRGLSVVENSGDYIAVLSNRGDKTISIINFGSSLSNNVVSDDVYHSSALTGSNTIFDMDVFKDCDTWYGMTLSINNSGVHLINFGSDLSSIQSESILTTLGLTTSLEINVSHDGISWKAIVSDITGNFKRLNFEDGIALPPTVDDLTTLSEISNASGLKIVKDSVGFVFDYSSEDLYRLNFGNGCNVSTEYFLGEQPEGINYEKEGTRVISLKGTDLSGNIGYDTVSIDVTLEIAPAISFLLDESRCVGNINSFSAIDEGGVSNYSWDFNGDDIEDENVANPTYQYPSSGEYLTRLVVDDGTCSNFVQEIVSIYPIPSPTFTSSEPYCTNTELTFTNTTDESNHEGATITYSWDYGDGNTEEATNGRIAYESATNYNVTLNMAIPGCSTDASETIEVIPGPEVSFITDNNCFGETMQFTNQTTGDNLTNPSWDFGDEAGSSILSNPQYIYGATGDFDVMLTMENTAGCVSVLIETVRVNGVPEVAFSNTPGCESQAVSFTDISIPGDALNNVNSWSWNFNDLGSAIDQNPDFVFNTSDNYLVSLTVGNTGGCFNTIEQTVIVQPVPIPSFDIELGCIDASTRFIDRSQTIAENEIASWYWVINEEEYFTQDVTEVFSEAGQYTASLVVTPNNLCIATIQDEFAIFDLPEPGFIIDDNCNNQLTILTDTSTSIGTSIISRSWSFENGDTANGQEIAYQYEEPGNYEVALQVTDNIGCINALEKEIEIFDAPTSAFSTAVTVGNAPLTVDFVNESLNSTDYIWNFGDSLSSQSSIENPQFIYDNLGIYTSQLIATNDHCSDSSFLEIIVAEPWFDLQLVSVENTESNGIYLMSVMIENQGLVNLEGFDIKIDLENQTSIYERYEDVLNRNETITYPINFSLPVEGNNVDFLCFTLLDREEEVDDLVSSNNSGCISFEEQAVVQNIFPNPLGANDHTLTVQAILSSKSSVQIYLINATGDVMFDQLFQGVDLGLTNFDLNVSGLRSGMYFVKVLHNGKEQTQKFIKP